MVKVISISLSDEHKQILDELKLSPSGLFKQRMEQVKEDSANFDRKIMELTGSRDKALKRVQSLCEFLEKKGLTDEYNKQDGID